MSKLIVITVLLAVLFFLDWYLYQAIALLLKNSSGAVIKTIRYAYWGFTAVTFSVILVYNFGNPDWTATLSVHLIHGTSTSVQ